MTVKQMKEMLENFDEDLEVTLSFELDGEGHTVHFDPSVEVIETNDGEDVLDLDIGDVECQDDYDGIPDVLDLDGDGEDDE